MAEKGTDPAPVREAPERQELVAAYKRLLQAYIDRRPSGTRRKIASALGTHRSFVSQILNPAYDVPVPARHLPTIFAICHFSEQERETFLKAYAAAHPAQRRRVAAAGEQVPVYRTLRIDVPQLGNPRLQREVEDMIRSFAERVILLASERGRPEK